MSKVNDAVTAVKDQLEADTTLAASVSGFTVFDDEIKLVNETKKFPFINVNCHEYKIAESGNIRLYDRERHTYGIIITFAVREQKKSTAATSVWTLADNIITAIKSDRTFSGNLRANPFRPEVATDAVKFQDAPFWVGRGILEFEAYTEVNLR